jgi:transcriptional antiterminator RfaH
MEQVESTGESPPKKLLEPVPEDSDLEWYCLYTRPRHEKAVARVCRHENVRFFLPLVRRVRQYKSGRKERWLPLFTGYLFCCADPGQRYDLSREKNLLSLLEVPDQEGLITELREIAKALEVSRELETISYLKEGQKVEIKSGSFRGIIGVVEEVGREFKVYLNVHMVGRSVPLEIDARNVEPVG